MRRIAVIGIGALLALGLLVVGPGASATGTLRSPWIGASTIELTQDHVLYENVLRAWVRTGSASPRCLVTLADESVGAAVNGHPTITTVCSGRDWKGGGVMLTVYLGEVPPPDAEFVIDYTIYQQGARGYASPILCSCDSGCAPDCG